MNIKTQKLAVPWPLVVLFIALSGSAATTGFFYYQGLKHREKENTLSELSAIADLKVRQIIQWREERYSDGKNLSSNTPYVKQFYKLLKEENNLLLRDDLLESLNSYVENYDYRNVLYIDKDINVKLFYPDRDTVIGDYLKALLPDVIDRGKVVLTDMHQTGKVSFTHLDLLVPLRNSELNDTSVFGVVVLRVDPEKILYPILQSWPLPSKTAEALLVHTEGNEIVYLNKLRHSANQEMAIRKPLSDNKLPSVMAVQGIMATDNAVDYRGVPVLAAMRKIPGTRWYLIAKKDQAEIFDTISGRLGQILLIIILFILTSGSLIGFLWWNQRMRSYRDMYEAEHERMALVKHFDFILKHANDIILLFNNDFIIVEANNKACEVYQYDRKELLGKNLEQLLSFTTSGRGNYESRILIESGHLTFETLHKRKDGTIFPVEISARKVDIEDTSYFQFIGRDITERKHAEEILKASEERFRKIFEESPFSMVMTGKDMGIVKANSAFCALLGYSEENLIGLTFRDFTHPDHIEQDQLSVFRLIKQEIPIYHTEKRYLRKDGSIIWGSTTVNIIRNEKGEAELFFAMIEDITARKKAENDLIAAKEKAEESDRLKTAFLHNVSHEIRTPMNAILGFSALLNEPGLGENEKKQFIDVIFQSGNQLLSIINDIVDLATIESGQVKLNIREINLNVELRRISEQFSYKTKAHNLSLNLETPLPDRDVFFLTDGTKLIQILSNLINNSFKFTKRGKITFGYKLSNDYLEFYVRDTGVGIPPEHKHKVFDRFYQADNAMSKQYSGTGLGLSICKAYVELLGGDIRLDSTPGEGSTFIFTTPFKKKEG